MKKVLVALCMSLAVFSCSKKDSDSEPDPGPGGKVDKVVTLKQPMDDGKVAYVERTLTWDKPAGMTDPTYDIYLSTDINPPKVGTTKETSFKFEIQKLHSRYWWKVVAKGGGREIESKTQTFKISDFALTLKTKADTVFSLEDKIVLEWEALNTREDVEYEVLLNDESIAKLSGTSYEVKDLGLGDYSWKVKGVNISSDARKFKLSNVIRGEIGGLTWKRLPNHDGPDRNSFLSPVYFKGKVYFFGGSQNYNPLSDYLTLDVTQNNRWDKHNMPFGGYGKAVVFKNELLLYKTSDVDKLVQFKLNGSTWTEAKTNLPKRYSFALVEFKGKLWALGGEKNVNGKYDALGEVWSSEDGVTWNKETDNGMGGKRYAFTCFVHGDKLYANGSMDRYPGVQNGYYSSIDGVNWTPVGVSGSLGRLDTWQNLDAVVVWRGYIWYFDTNGKTHVSKDGSVFKETEGLTGHNGRYTRYSYAIPGKDKMYFYGGKQIKDRVGYYVRDLFEGTLKLKAKE